MSDDLIRDSAARLYRESIDERMREAAEAGQWPEHLVNLCEQTGLLDALGRSPALDSLDAAAVIASEAGRHAAPMPIVELLIARWLGRPDAAVGIRRPGLGSSTTYVVPWATRAEQFVLLDEEQIVVMPAASVKNKPRSTYAGEPQVDVQCEVLPTAQRIGDARLAIIATRVHLLLRLQQMAGAMEAALALTVQYANDRVQFGRSLGKFQAVEHQLAIVAEESASSRVAADDALRCVLRAGATELVSWRALAAAKIRCSEAAGKVVDITHQVHGAIGFSREYRLHPLTRRLMSWRDDHGSEALWAGKLGAAVAAHGVFWEFVTERDQ